jgi:lysine biosynthesis protein LysW
MASATCPDCGSFVPVADPPRRGERVTCPTCGASLQVSALNPPELEWAYDDPEDEVKLDFESEEDRDKR